MALIYLSDLVSKRLRYPLAVILINIGRIMKTIHMPMMMNIEGISWSSSIKVRHAIVSLELYTMEKREKFVNIIKKLRKTNLIQ